MSQNYNTNIIQRQSRWDYFSRTPHTLLVPLGSRRQNVRRPYEHFVNIIQYIFQKQIPSSCWQQTINIDHPENLSSPDWMRGYNYTENGVVSLHWRAHNVISTSSDTVVPKTRSRRMFSKDMLHDGRMEMKPAWFFLLFSPDHAFYSFEETLSKIALVKNRKHYAVYRYQVLQKSRSICTLEMVSFRIEFFSYVCHLFSKG